MLDWIASWPGAVFIRDSGTAYMFVNAAHILGIALLLGAILPLDVRLAAGGRDRSLSVIGPYLQRVAVTGLVLAVVTGFWLFSVKPDEYVDNTAFLAKLAILGLAIANVGIQHWGGHLAQAMRGRGAALRVRALAGLSLVSWVSVLVAGRWIGFI